MVITLSTENFEAVALQSTKPVLVDFWASWCSPCNAMAPIIEQLAQKHQEKLSVASVDIESNPELAARYGIRAVPTFLLLQNGELKAKVTGSIALAKLEQLLELE